MSVRMALMILAIICFALAAAGITMPRSLNLMATGLGLWALATIINV